jgi:hypothetical protein
LPRALAYVVYARPQSYAQGGTFVGYLAGEASKEEGARAALLNEFRRLGVDGFTAAEVAARYFSGDNCAYGAVRGSSK